MSGHQTPRSVYDAPNADERFYAKAFGILVRPARRLAIAAKVGNLVFAGILLAAAGFASEQLWDRADPVRFLSVEAQPDHVAAGDSVRVDLAVERFKRCDYTLEWDILDSSREVWHFRGGSERAPGAPGLDRYMHRYATSRGMAPGPATLMVSLQATCPGNVLQRYWPLTVDMPPVTFDVDAAPSPLHDAAPGVDR